MALDVIGETGMSNVAVYTPGCRPNIVLGFGYKFDTLTEDPHHKNELHEAFKVMFRVGSAPSVVRLLRGLVPITRYLVRAASI